VGARVLHRFLQLGHDMLGRRHIRIAHAEIDDIDTFGARLCLQRIDMGKHVGRQAADAMEDFAHFFLGRPL